MVEYAIGDKIVELNACLNGRFFTALVYSHTNVEMTHYVMCFVLIDQIKYK